MSGGTVLAADPPSPATGALAKLLTVDLFSCLPHASLALLRTAASKPQWYAQIRGLTGGCSYPCLHWQCRLLLAMHAHAVGIT